MRKSFVQTFCFFFDPVQEAVDSGIDARFLSYGTFIAPASHAVESPAPVSVTHERTTGVALAWVPTTFWIASADHVVCQFAAVPATLAALRLADDWHVNLIQHRRITRRWNHNFQY